MHPEDTEDIINQYIIFCKALDDEKESARKKAKLMLRDGKISQNEISTYFPELSSEDIEEVIGETMQLV